MTQAAHLKERELYLQDCRETDEPWLRWECSPPEYEGRYLRPESEIVWRESTKYRRIAQTITINGVKVSAPLIVAPETGTSSWVALVGAKGFTNRITYVSCPTYKDYLNRGLLHSSKEAAIAHAKALILASGGVV